MSTDISKDVKGLRKIMPNAVITAHMEDKCLNYECDLRHVNIDDKESEQLFSPIKELFGERFIERYSLSTSHFNVYVRYEANKTNLN